MSAEFNPGMQPAANTGVNPYATPRAMVTQEEGDDETQEVRILAVSGRMGRIRYVANTIGIYILFMIMMFAVGAAMGGARMRSGTGVLVLSGVLWLGMIVIQFMMAIQRCHDFDKSGWWSVLILIPIVNFFFGLYLVFMPGTAGRNSYGPKTPPNSTFSVILACTLPALMVIGIIAAVALPAYQQYGARAKMQQAR
jgi:uncharacterized membrane protein YhaH (DUF805 family)